jgi:hypothetical protein
VVPKTPQEQVCAFASINDDGLKFVLVESDWVNTRVPWQPRPWLIGHLLLILVVLSCARVTHVNTHMHPNQADMRRGDAKHPLSTECFASLRHMLPRWFGTTPRHLATPALVIQWFARYAILAGAT